MAKAKKLKLPEIVYGFVDDGRICFDDEVEWALGAGEYRKRVGVYVLDHEADVTVHYTTTVVPKKQEE